MKSFKLMTIVAGVMALAALAGCQQKVEDPYIRVVGDDAFNLTQSKSSVTVKIESNRDWAVRMDSKAAEWMVVEPARGTASDKPTEVTVTVTENTGANRTAAIEFYTGVATAMVTVSQAGPKGDSDGIESLTVLEFISKADKNTYYRLTGTVSRFSASYCSFDLTDATGTIYVFSVSESSKAEWVNKIKNGGTVTLQGQYDYYVNPKTNVGQHEVINAIIESFTGGGDVQPGNPEGDGSQASPFNVAAACQAVQNLTWNSNNDCQKVGPYYVKGKVSAISQDYTYNVSDGRTYGNARFSMSDDGSASSQQFTLYNLYYLGNNRFVAGQTDIKIGDDVIIYAELMNYQNNTPENSGGYLYSLNGDTGGGSVTPGETVTGTVAETIAAHDDDLVVIPEAQVMAKSKAGIVVADATGSVYLFFNSKNGETVPDVAVGDNVKVEATKSTYGGIPEFTKPTVTKLSGGTAVYPEPRDLNPVAASYESAVTEFVTLTGTLKISGNYVNIEINGADPASRQGSVSQPLDSFGVNSFDGKQVTVTGYFTGITTSKDVKYINIVITDIALADPNAKYCNVTPATISAKADATSATFTISANAAWTVTSDNEAFVVSPASGDADATVTVTFSANEGDSPRVANLTVVCADANVETVVVLTQAKPSSGEALTISLDFTTEISGFPQTSANGIQDGTYNLGGYDFKFHAADKFYQGKNSATNTLYILIGKANSYIELPAIEGKALTKVKFLTGAGASENVVVDVAKTDNTRLNVNNDKLLKGKEYEWEIAGEAGVAYRLLITTAYNAQYQNLTLTYE